MTPGQLLVETWPVLLFECFDEPLVCGNEARLDLNVIGQGSMDCRFDKLRIVETAKDSLRALIESFALFLELTKNFDESYEEKLGGWGENQKYIDADSMDLAISRAEAGDAAAIKRARQTLDAAIALIDPVCGGVFQVG